MRQLFFLLGLAIALSGCVSTQVTMLESVKYAPTLPDSVRIFLTENDVGAPFKKIALIHMQGEASLTTESKMIAAAKKKAAKIGANGIILGKIKEPSTGEKIVGAVFGTTTERRGEVTAILIKPAEDKVLHAQVDEDSIWYNYIRDYQKFEYDRRLISDSELEALSPNQLRILRNTFYARHGRIFQSQDLREFFNSCEWYRPREDFNEKELNDFEKENIKNILELEKGVQEQRKRLEN
jgi:hypothetical protein